MGKLIFKTEATPKRIESIEFVKEYFFCTTQTEAITCLIDNAKYMINQADKLRNAKEKISKLEEKLKNHEQTKI